MNYGDETFYQMHWERLPQCAGINTDGVQCQHLVFIGTKCMACRVQGVQVE